MFIYLINDPLSNTKKLTNSLIKMFSTIDKQPKQMRKLKKKSIEKKWKLKNPTREKIKQIKNK